MPPEYERPEGVTDYEWQIFMREVEEAEASILKRICPYCRHTLIKSAQEAPGLWFSYECTNAECGFVVEQEEFN